MAVILPPGVSLDFARRHYQLFEETIDPVSLDHTVTYRERVLPESIVDALGVVDWEAGSAEPWTADLLAALLVANRAETVLEVGGFHGFTSKRLARALNSLRRGSLTVCEIDPERASRTQAELDVLRLPHVTTTVVLADSHAYLPTLSNESVDFVWLDGNHEAAHVQREIELLLPKMRPAGLITGHDVWGSCDLQAVFRAFGGYALDVPRLGPAGGVGIIQVP